MGVDGSASVADMSMALRDPCRCQPDTQQEGSTTVIHVVSRWPELATLMHFYLNHLPVAL